MRRSLPGLVLTRDDLTGGARYPALFMKASPVERRHRVVAYFSMEVGLESDMPTYSGGLGVLAGDTLKAGADLGVPMIGITLVHREGYLRQTLDDSGGQSATPDAWDPATRLDLMPERCSIVLEGRRVELRAWRSLLKGIAGYTVPVYFLDSDVEENAPEDRTLTNRLYGGDAAYRLKQEAILGLGGVALLRRLGHGGSLVHHLNEGHSALLVLALLAEHAGDRGLAQANELDQVQVRRRCVFTTHTPVPAGHDVFPMDLVRRVLGDGFADALVALNCVPEGGLNMTHLALAFSRFVNGVAMRHGEVSRKLFPGYPINSITNGVHAPTWAAPSFAALYDRHLPQWRRNNSTLRHAVGIPLEEIAEAHRVAKERLLAAVESRTGMRLDADVLTLGFARRATEYKRADLVFADVERLRAIGRATGGLQLVFAGKAHPNDWGGQDMIRRVVGAGGALRDDVKVTYLQGYDMELGGILTSGADAWLNTPRKPHEASGTSGMKSALNGVPSLSILDGWWLEGCVEGVTGWAIGDSSSSSLDERQDSAELYDKLEHAVAPAYRDHARFTEIRRQAIALNASHFHAQRMLRQYAHGPYELAYGGPSDLRHEPAGGDEEE